MLALSVMENICWSCLVSLSHRLSLIPIEFIARFKNNTIGYLMQLTMNLLLFLIVFGIKLRTSLLSRLWHCNYRGKRVISLALKTVSVWKRHVCPIEKFLLVLKRALQVVGNKLVIFMFIFGGFSVQQLACEDQWKELTQYFGINDRFESPVDSRAPQKVIIVNKRNVLFYLVEKKKSVLTEIKTKLNLIESRQMTKSL